MCVSRSPSYKLQRCQALGHQTQNWVVKKQVTHHAFGSVLCTVLWKAKEFFDIVMCASGSTSYKMQRYKAFGHQTKDWVVKREVTHQTFAIVFCNLLWKRNVSLLVVHAKTWIDTKLIGTTEETASECFLEN